MKRVPQSEVILDDKKDQFHDLNHDHSGSEELYDSRTPAEKAALTRRILLKLDCKYDSMIPSANLSRANHLVL